MSDTTSTIATFAAVRGAATSATNEVLEPCEEFNAHSDFTQYAINFSEPSFEEIRAKYPDLQIGGEWVPNNCTPNDHVAIVIPYADRPLHLRTLLNNLFNFLQIQKLHHAIYLIEPLPNQTFNRGKLMNIGFQEARKDFFWNCSIFHDVDLIPESLAVSYACPYRSPRHLAAYINKWDYKLYWPHAFFGVVGFANNHYAQCNGFANQFWGWGGEDDELFRRYTIKTK